MFENYLRNFIVPVLIEFDFFLLLKIYRIEDSPLHSNVVDLSPSLIIIIYIKSLLYRKLLHRPTYSKRRR